MMLQKIIVIVSTTVCIVQYLVVFVFRSDWRCRLAPKYSSPRIQVPTGTVAKFERSFFSAYVSYINCVGKDLFWMCPASVDTYHHQKEWMASYLHPPPTDHRSSTMHSRGALHHQSSLWLPIPNMMIPCIQFLLSKSGAMSFAGSFVSLFLVAPDVGRILKTNVDSVDHGTSSCCYPKRA